MYDQDNESRGQSINSMDTLRINHSLRSDSQATSKKSIYSTSTAKTIYHLHDPEYLKRKELKEKCYYHCNNFMKKLSLYKQHNGIFHKGEIYYQTTSAFGGTVIMLLGAIMLFYSNFSNINKIVGVSTFYEVKDNSNFTHKELNYNSPYHEVKDSTFKGDTKKLKLFPFYIWTFGNECKDVNFFLSYSTKQVKD